jgi:hypothetical protein
MTLRAILVALAVLGPLGRTVAWAQDLERSGTAPPRALATHAALFVLQGIAGVGGGFLGALALGAAGAEVIGPHGGEDPGLMGAFIGGLVGFTLGVGGGVSAMARSQREPSSFARASAGALLGVGLVGALAGPLHLDPDRAPFWISLATIPPAAAVWVNHAGGNTHHDRLRLVARPLGGGRLGLGASVGF